MTFFVFAVLVITLKSDEQQPDIQQQHQSIYDCIQCIEQVVFISTIQSRT